VTRALHLAPLLLAVLTAAGSCSKRKTVAWRPEMRRWFDNSTVGPNDESVDGWTRRDEELFLRRIGYADVAAIGTVRMVTTFSHHRSPRQVALAFRPRELLYGTLEGRLDAQGELALVLGEAMVGVRVARLLSEHLPGRRYLLFLKDKPVAPGPRHKVSGWRASLWRPPPVPRPEHRWALYRPEPRLLRQVRAMYRWLRHKGEDKPKETDSGKQRKRGK